MFLGHFAAGLAAKRAAPGVSLGTLFFAAQFADVLWPLLVAAGIERVRIDPGNTASTAGARRCGYRLTGEPPILQEGPYGPTSLDTWELVDGRAGARLERLRNVAARRYGRRG